MGASTTIGARTSCSPVNGNGENFFHPSISVDTGGKLYATYEDQIVVLSGGQTPRCTAQTPATGASFSTNGTVWSAASGISTSCITSSSYAPILAKGTTFWAINFCDNSGTIFKDVGGAGTWTSVTTTGIPYNTSVSVGGTTTDKIDFLYDCSGICYKSYTISTNTLSSATTLSTGASDTTGAIVTSGSNIYAIWSSNISTNSYDLVYKKFNGSTWDTIPTGIIGDGLNNLYVNAPLSRSAGSLPFIWSEGTASPYNIKSAVVPVPNTAPRAPTLIAPASGATGASTTPTFQLRTTEADNDYVKYKLIIYNSDCSTGPITLDQTASQTGWSGQDQQTSTAYTGRAILTNSTIATYTGTVLSPSTTYCWKVAAIDPGGSNSFGSFSATQLFTTGINNTAPNVPTLLSPSSSANATSTNPLFQLRASDVEADYLKYKILIYNSDCITGLQTFDQTSSQIGWTGQDQQGLTAYTGGSSLAGSTIATFGQTNLTPSTTYCWKAAAIDPGGTNTFGSFSATQLFTTGAANSGTVNITGGATVQGGAYVR